MPLKVKIIHIYNSYLMYKHLYNMTLNLDIAFFVSQYIYGIKQYDIRLHNKIAYLILLCEEWML